MKAATVTLRRPRPAPVCTIERRGLRFRWEVWWKGSSGGGPVRSGRAWTRRSAQRRAGAAMAAGFRTVVVVAAAVGLLAGCGDPPPTAGYVRDADHRAAFTQHWTDMVCAAYDPKTFTCTVQVPVDRSEFHPERWRLLLEDCDDVDDHGRVKCRRGWREVTEAEWRSHPVGTHYRDPR